MAIQATNKSQFGERFAILTGTFSGGFSIQTVKHGKATAEDFVVSLLANGTLAEAVPILWPSDKDNRIDDADHMTGTKYVFLAEPGVGAGFTIYGPFDNDDYEALSDFGEEHRPEDGEWSEEDDASGTLMVDLLTA